MCVSAGEGVGDPSSRRAEEPHGSVEGAPGPQPQSGPHRVAPDRQQRPLQHGLRLQGDTNIRADTATKKLHANTAIMCHNYKAAKQVTAVLGSTVIVNKSR